MPTRIAKCSCGQLTATVEGDPIRISVCHCLACHRRTGSVFGAQARFARANVRFSGQGKEFVRVETYVLGSTEVRMGARSSGSGRSQLRDC
ncbi:MAG: hypothetical protein HIU85_13605 [Proteobacteria bacterium]|nr:hypothetical protein [Pseudomonadota bacterium]